MYLKIPGPTPASTHHPKPVRGIGSGLDTEFCSDHVDPGPVLIQLRYIHIGRRQQQLSLVWSLYADLNARKSYQRRSLCCSHLHRWDRLKECVFGCV